MMKRILEVVNGMNMGGIENFVMNVLRNIDTDKYKVDFLYTLKAETYFDQEILARGCHIYKVSGRSEGVLSHLKELNTFFKEHKGYDVVHIHYAFSSCFTVAMYARLYGVKNIIIHSHNTNAPHRILHYMFRPLLSLFGTQFCACSEMAARWMFSLPLHKVNIIHNAIDSDKYLYSEIDRKAIREELQIEEDCKVIGCIGRLAPQKNHVFLLKIMRQVVDRDPKTILLIIGDGPLKGHLLNEVQTLGLADNVKFLGVRNDIPSLLSAMDLFVLPSLFEGLGIVFIEAQCNGLNCFGTEKHVPKEAQISELMHYLSLEKLPSEWAHAILNVKPVKDRIRYNRCAKDYGYSMEYEIKQIELLYDK